MCFLPPLHPPNRKPHERSRLGNDVSLFIQVPEGVLTGWKSRPGDPARGSGWGRGAGDPETAGGNSWDAEAPGSHEVGVPGAGVRGQSVRTVGTSGTLS